MSRSVFLRIVSSCSNSGKFRPGADVYVKIPDGRDKHEGIVCKLFSEERDNN